MQLNNNDVWLAFSKTFDYIQIALTHSNIDASSSGCAIVGAWSHVCPFLCLP